MDEPDRMPAPGRGRAPSARIGGAWKVAYADLTTAMMGLFLVLWLVGQGPSVREAVAGYFQDPLGARHQRGDALAHPPGQGGSGMPAPGPALRAPRPGRSLDRTALALRRQLALLDPAVPLATLPRVRVRDGGLEIELRDAGGAPLFDADGTEPGAAGGALLRALGAELGALGWDVVLETHPPRSAAGDPWNVALGRIAAARRMLAEGGLPPGLVVRASVAPARRASGDERPVLRIRALPPEASELGASAPPAGGSGAPSGWPGSAPGAP